MLICSFKGLSFEEPELVVVEKNRQQAVDFQLAGTEGDPDVQDKMSQCHVDNNLLVLLHGALTFRPRQFNFY